MSNPCECGANCQECKECGEPKCECYCYHYEEEIDNYEENEDYEL